ncbi:MAG: HD domain-containing protein [Candidatus Magasanikiibacteriota bacterium]
MNKDQGFTIERGVSNVDDDIEARLGRMTGHLSGEDIDVHLERARSADAVINAQLDFNIDNIVREGWKKRGVKEDRRETVGEHTAAMTELFYSVIDDIDKEKQLDRKKMLRMIQAHDWVEGITGDQIAYHADATVERDLKAEKKKKEITAMQTICAKLGDAGKEIMDLWFEYENKSSREGQIIFELDKVQTVMKAFQYQKEGEPVSAQQFIDGYREREMISEKTFLDIIKSIEEESKKLI